MNTKPSTNGLTLKPVRRHPGKQVGGVHLGRARSTEARKQAAAILEVLAGLRTPQQAASALAVSVPRYYQLEQRGLEGLLSSCEPRPRGRMRSEAREVEKLRLANERLQQDLSRQQTLLRLAQRNIGLAPAATPVKQPGKKRARRPVKRALAVAHRLRQDNGSAETPVPVQIAPTGV
jgi:hypothetical protein